jgi:hypothetical protein
MRQKEEFLAAGERVQDGDPSYSLPPPQWQLWSRACKFSGKLAGFQTYKSAGGSFGGGPVGFPKSTNSLIILKLMILSRNFFYEIDA